MEKKIENRNYKFGKRKIHLPKHVEFFNSNLEKFDYIKVVNIKSMKFN